MAISVVLHGDANDKSTLQTAVRFAAREHTPVRLVIGEGCSEREMAKHLDFCRWDVETRLGLASPQFIIERAGTPAFVGRAADETSKGSAPQKVASAPFTQLMRSVHGLLLSARR